MEKVPLLTMKNGQLYRGHNAFRSISANFNEHSIQFHENIPERQET